MGRERTRERAVLAHSPVRLLTVRVGAVVPAGPAPTGAGCALALGEAALGEVLQVQANRVHVLAEPQGDVLGGHWGVQLLKQFQNPRTRSGQRGGTVAVTGRNRPLI